MMTYMFVFKQKTEYEMRISDWSSDVCSSDLPETLATLASLGIRDGARVWHMVSGWHHGRYRALRSTRSRELLTELVPLLLQTFGKTQEPDRALVKFAGFVAGLPAGMQPIGRAHV